MRTFFLSCLVIAVSPLAAQQLTLSSPTDLLHAPNGRAVATIRAGTEVASGPTRSGYVQVVLEGFVPARALGAARDSFPVTIRDNSTDLRRTASATAAAVADLRQGMGLMEVRRSGDWVLVRRTGWIRQPATAAPSQPAAVVTTPARSPGPAIPDSASLVTSKKAELRESPGGRSIATLADSARIESLYRERGWVRVRVEGWVRDAEVDVADSSLRSALMPSDLRADPEGTKGKLVRWEVQKIALQNADPLQRDMARDEPYMLARGPGADHALVYLSLPPSLIVPARRIAPLAFVTVIARVRNGRSAPGGVPILDVQSLIAK
jgi:hypothetical protein